MTPEFAGAPPVKRVRPRVPAQASRLAWISLGLTALGAVLIPILTVPLGSNGYIAFSLPPWGPAASILLTGFVFAAAIVLAVLSRVAAGRSVYGALAWAIAGGLAWVLVLWAADWSRGLGPTFMPASLYSQELLDSPVTIEDPMPFGTEVVLRTLGTREPVLIVTVEEPEIVTQQAIEHGLPAPEGDYIAVPLRIEVVDPTAAARGVTLPRRDWITRLSPEAIFLDGLTDTNLPGYPSAERLDLSDAGTHLVYDLIDTSAYGAGKGAYTWSLIGRGSPDDAHWR